MTKTIIAVLAWYIVMVILSWSTPDIEEDEEEKPEEQKTLWDNPLLAYVGIECPYELVEAVEEWDIVSKEGIRTPQPVTIIELEIETPKIAE